MQNIYKDLIKKYDLCIGCGMCATLSSSCILNINEKGFYEPEWKKFEDKENNLLKSICPGIKVVGENVNGIWGTVLNVYKGWSKDKELRFKSASGGVVSSLAIYLLEIGKVDAVLQIGKKEGDCLLNELKISRSKQDIFNNTSSRYAPAPTFVDFINILSHVDFKFLFIGKPCDIAALKNFLRVHPEYHDRFIFTISIFCAGMPSYKASLDLCKKSGIEIKPEEIKYRGNGWPGNFKAKWDDGKEFELSYEESWGKHLGRALGYRCKICPDGIGLLADLAVGDCWETKNGYPDFSEGEGISFILSRSSKGEELINDAYKKGYVDIKIGDLSRLKSQQYFQYRRRKECGWRLFPLFMITKFAIKFKHLSIVKSSLQENLFKGIKSMLGSYKRLANGK